MSPPNGFSVKMPTTWIVFDKENRFDEGLDFEAYTPFQDKIPADYNRLVIVKNNVLMDRAVKSMGLENYTDYQLLLVGNSANTTLIEGVNMTKYKIGGYETSTLLSVGEYQGDYIVTNELFVNQDGRIWQILYQGLAQDFDSPRNQEIMNRVLNSIIFTR